VAPYNQLMQDEKIIYKTKLHWIVFLSPAFYFVISLVILSRGNLLIPEYWRSPLPSAFTGFRLFQCDMIQLLGALIFFTKTVPIAFGTSIRYLSSQFWVSNRRVIVNTGFVRRASFETFLTKIEGIGVEQNILGVLLNYGTIIISGIGGSERNFENMKQPLVFRRKVQEQILSP